MTRYFVEEGDVPETTAGPGRVARHLVTNDTVGAEEGFSFGVVSYRPGASTRPHSHSDQEAMYVVAGEGVAVTGGVRFRLKPGVALYVPRGVSHCIANTGSTNLDAVYAHSP